jgi:DNA helicase-2/ATP-dependent DNA helicase PcrA
MKILLAGPGTGKTFGIKHIIQTNYYNANNILVLSFTNATVNDLTNAFQEWSNVKCYTLHKYALKINHLTDYYILDSEEQLILDDLKDYLQVESSYLFELLKCISFNGMISECINFLRINKEYANQKIGDLDILIIDEYQDFNQNERQLIDILSSFAKETLILGDDDQSIYGFKDADPDGIISLYSNNRVEKIPHENNCYRCPDDVVECATKLIIKNKNRIHKTWNKTGILGDVIIKQKLTSDEINTVIVNEISRLRNENSKYSILILSPVSFYTSSLLQKLQGNGIDFVNFLDTKIDTYSWARIWILRILYTKRKLLNIILLSSRLSSYNKRKFKDALKSAIQKSFNEDLFISTIIRIFGPIVSNNFTNNIDIDQFVEKNIEYEYIGDLINKNDLEKSIEHLPRIMKPEIVFDSNKVNVMSIHKSKGLQADIVFITGLVDGVLPNSTKGLDTVEAQRRLLFVGLTRARKKLYLLSSVYWEGKYVNKVDKSQFNYNYKNKKYSAKTSKFVTEMI